MTTTWTVAIDWDRNGTYTDTYDDVSSRVISAEWFLGIQTAYQDTADNSVLKLVLSNYDKRYSPEYASSPLTGKVLPFRTVRIQSNDGTTTRTHWVGWVEEIQPSVNQYGERQATITAIGPMAFFKNAETSIALQENQTTDAIIALLIQQVVIPPALTAGWLIGMQAYGELGTSTYLANVTSFSILDQGKIQLAIAADNWVQRSGAPNDPQEVFNVYAAIADVTAAERGRFLFDRVGNAVFWNRQHLQDNTASSVTLNDTMNDLTYTYASINDFKNEVIVACHPRTVSTVNTDILWQLAEPMTIPPGQTYSLSVKYQDTTNGNLRIGAKNVAVNNIVFSSGTATITIQPEANSATLQMVNNGNQPAVLTSCNVIGTKITDYGRMEAKANDTVSIGKYGRRSVRMNLPSVDNFQDAQNIANYEIVRHGQPRGTISQIKLTSQATLGTGNQPQQLARTLGDVVTVSETQTSHNNRRYVIIGESHKLSNGATLLETTWYVEPAAESPFFWKLGVTGRSEVGNATQLAF